MSAPGLPVRRARLSPALLWPLAVAALAGGLLLSLAVGAVNLPPAEVWRALAHPGSDTGSLIVWSLRLPRTLVALLAGAALGVSGALLQGVTRNPLADPGILGVTAGASLALLAGLVLVPALPGALLVPLAFAGGVGAAALVFAIASGVGLTPLRLALSGVAVASLAVALASGLQTLFAQRAQAALFSLVGSVANRSWPQLEQAAPWLLAGLLAALLGAPRLNLLALGDDVTRALGTNPARTTLWFTGLAALLAAGAASVAGPVGFIGLVAPHLARGLVGPDHRRLLPLAAVLGGALLLWADVAARRVAPPVETPVGVLVALIGVPFFVLLARGLRRDG